MAVSNVTGHRNGAALLARLLSPRSHVLVKVVGGTISASWDVTNTGGIAAFGHLTIASQATGGGVAGGDFLIAAGATLTLSVSATIVSIAPGSYPSKVILAALAPATIAPGGVHDFTLTIGAAPPILGPLDLFYAPAANWIGNPLQLTWFAQIATFYGMPSINTTELRFEGTWVIFFVFNRLDITRNFGLVPVIPGLNA